MPERVNSEALELVPNDECICGYRVISQESFHFFHLLVQLVTGDRVVRLKSVLSALGMFATVWYVLLAALLSHFLRQAVSLIVGCFGMY